MRGMQFYIVMQSQQKKYWICSKIDNNTAEVLLYGYVDQYDVSAGDFVKELRSLEKEGYATINVRINSGGGSVFEGFAIYNAIKQSKCDVNTYIDGLAASMASIIALAGKKVYMSKVARFMTHQPSSGSYGNSEELRKNADLLDGLEKTMCAIYAAKTGKSMDDCKEKFLNGKDNWFSAEDAKKECLVDELYDADGIQMPEETASIESVWGNYEHQFAAKFNQSQNNNMEKITLSAASKAALGITGEVADFSALDTAISALKAKADKADEYKTGMESARTELDTLKKENLKQDVSAQLAKALDEKRITVEQQTVLSAQYAENPDGLKAILATMKPYESKVNSPANTSAAVAAELSALMAKSGHELWTSGKLTRLKELDKEAWKTKYKEAFEEEPPVEE